MKTPVQSFFFNKVAGLQASNFIKKETLAQMFSCELCEIFNNTFLQNTSVRLLLYFLQIVQIVSKKTQLSCLLFSQNDLS